MGHLNVCTNSKKKQSSNAEIQHSLRQEVLQNVVLQASANSLISDISYTNCNTRYGLICLVSLK